MLKNWTRSQAVSIGSKIGLMGLSILIALGLVEFAARQFLNPPYSKDNGNLWQCERTLGWRGKRNTVTTINTEGYVHEVVRNSAGMHDGEHSRQKDKDVFRILVLGDSFVEARQVAEQESSHAVIESFLNAASGSNIRYEVISAGASAWGPAQELMYFRTEGQFYAPDLVLVFWYPANDLSDVLPEHRMTFEGTNCYAPYFAICNGRFDAEPWFSAPGISPTKENCYTVKKILNSVLNYLYHQSRLYQQLEPLFVKNQSSIKYAFEFSPWLENNHDEILDYAYQVTDGIYTNLASEANRSGAKIVVVIIPLKQAVYYELGSPFREQIEIQYPGLKGVAPRSPNQIITTLMMAKGIHVLDLQPAFVEHLRAGGGVIYWNTDSHWNIPGNQMAGELIARWLVNNQLVPLSP